MPTSDTIISVENVTKTFILPTEKKGSLKQHLISFGGGRKTKKFTALNNISFEIKQGEFFGIVGRNGSGKSTLLKMLAGIYQPTKGKIKINGKLTPFIELGIGFNPELTGKENIFLNGAILGLTEKQVIDLYDEIVDFAELKKFMDLKLKNYSSGMQVRLAFSIAIRAQTDILLLDEVLAVGDENFQQKCFRYFDQLKKSGRTVILVTHDMSTVKKYCTRAILIDSSKLLLNGKPEMIANEYSLSMFEPSADKRSSPESNSGDDKLVDIKEVSRIGNTDKVLTVNDVVNVKVRYLLKTSTKHYCGYSLIRDGISVAEHNSTEQITLNPKKGNNKSVELIMPLVNLQPGSYELNIAFFDFNKQLIGYSSGFIKFIIDGEDPTRGGVLKIDSEWLTLEVHSR
ncbi:ATP-binding cassette domain-containing protein [Candidatus Nomurabacteria bacterium]|nr:ATP-binding cassette domain-containing protein [Candidatus Nomurabacteria bacterium]